MLFITQEGGDRVPGWFDYAELYERVVRDAPPGSVLVEVGVFCGKSLIHLGGCAKEANKGLTVVGVDTFAGSPEHQEALSGQSAGAIIHDAYTHIAEAGLLDAVTLVAAPSVRAAKMLAPSRPWFVFLDADHSEEAVRADIDAWATHLADGGILAGHDYHTFPGVKAAVDDIFQDAVTAADRSWWECDKVKQRRMTIKPLPSKVHVLVVIFTYSKQIGADVYRYSTELPAQMKGHDCLGELEFAYTVGYPTDRCRNAALKGARDAGFHYILMLDDDQIPDCELADDPNAKPFLPTALSFAHQFGHICCVGAPYCAGPPMQEVVVMKNRQRVPGLKSGCGYELSKYTRDEAAVQTGISRVAALPTGCLLIDTRVTDVLSPPWFYYEYADKPFNTVLASTEDVVFSRNLDWIGVPQFCTWDSWAGHAKWFDVLKPQLSPVDEVPNAVHEAWSKYGLRRRGGE